MTERIEKYLKPELKEDDIAYDLQVDPDDDLGDAKQHVRHAESKIHALRARIKNRKARKAGIMISDSFTTNGVNSTGMTTTTTTTSMSTMTAISIKRQIIELEQKLRDKNEINLDYQKKLGNLGDKDGLITKLQEEKEELRAKASNAKTALAQFLEKKQKLESQLSSMLGKVSELSTVQDETKKLKETLLMREKDIKLQTSLHNEQLQLLEEKNAELLELKEVGENLTLKLQGISGRTDEEQIRLLEEKKALSQDLVGNKSEIANAKELNAKLRKEVEDWKKQGNQLNITLSERNGKLGGLQLRLKNLKADATLFTKQQRQLKKLRQELAEQDDELDRQRRQNSQLTINKKTVNDVLLMQKLRLEKNGEVYLETEKKISEFENKSVENKEFEQQERMKNLKKEIKALKLKYEEDIIRNKVLWNENERLNHKLKSSQDSSLQTFRKLRETLDENVVKETKLNKLSSRTKNELAEVVASAAQSEEMYLSLKKMYNEEKAKRKPRSRRDQRKFEEDLRKKIIKLQKKAAKKNVRIARSRDLVTHKKRELAIRKTRMNQITVKLNKKDEQILKLEKRFERRNGGKTNTVDGEKFKAQIKLYEEKLETLRAEAMKYQDSESQLRSEIEAQLKLIESKDEMIKARDEKIKILKNAKRRADGSVILSESDLNAVFGIQVTSVVDQRGNTEVQPTFYKHNQPLSDFHDHVLLVDKDPQYCVETDLEMLARRMKHQASKKRKLDDRRPSLT